MRGKERKENTSDQILHGRLTPTGSRNLFTARHKKKRKEKVNQLINNVSTTRLVFMQHSSLCSLFDLHSERGRRKHRRSRILPRLSRRHNTSFLPAWLRVNRRPLFLYLCISQGQRTWLGMWRQDRGFLQTCFTSVNSIPLFLMWLKLVFSVKHE